MEDGNIVMIVFGVIFFAVGIILLSKQLKGRKNNTWQVTAQVIRYDEEVSSSSGHGMGNVVYYPVLRYYANGAWHEGRTDTGSVKKPYSLGQNMDVLCNPEKPEEFRVIGDNSGLIMAAAAMAIGIGLCILAFVQEV